MKKIIRNILLATLLLFAVRNASAQKKAEIQIRTSAECEMCEETMRYHLSREKGVLDAKLDVPTKILTVKYNTEKTTPEKIRKAISLAGYDADDISADSAAYEKLSACCRKGAHESEK